jgi:hypothetical protein
MRALQHLSFRQSTGGSKTSIIFDKYSKSLLLAGSLQKNVLMLLEEEASTDIGGSGCISLDWGIKPGTDGP